MNQAVRHNASHDDGACARDRYPPDARDERASSLLPTCSASLRPRLGGMVMEWCNADLPQAVPRCCNLGRAVLPPLSWSCVCLCGGLECSHRAATSSEETQKARRRLSGKALTATGGATRRPAPSGGGQSGSSAHALWSAAECGVCMKASMLDVCVPCCRDGVVFSMCVCHLCAGGGCEFHLYPSNFTG